MDIERLELAHEVLELLKRFSQAIDLKGHELAPLEITHFLPSLYALPTEQLCALRDATASQQPLKDPVAISDILPSRCFVCAEKLTLLLDGTSIKPETPCPYPNGISLAFELDVPSGVMVVANFLWPSFGDISDLINANPHGQSLNMAAGRIWHSKTLAERGCACAAVYDSCPSIYRVNKNELLIAKPGYDPDTDKKFPPEGEYVCQVITDWYWYAIADKNNLKQRGDDIYGPTDEVSVRPGVYTFEHFVDIKGFHKKPDRETKIYTRITWTRPSDKK